MIQLIKGVDSNVVLTLTEKTTPLTAYYLFVFTHETTKEVVSFNLPKTYDLSSHTSRYNEFLISASYFTTSTPGKWTYEVYDNISVINIDPATLNQVECGKMDLNASTEFSFGTYNTTTTYTQYNG